MIERVTPPISREALGRAAILIVGDAMLDQYWFGDVDRISPEAPVPIVHVKREEYRLGGAANVALNVRELGARPRLLSIAGTDEASRTLRGLLDEHAIEHTLATSPDASTIVKLRVSGRSQQLLRVDFEREPTRELLSDLGTEFEQQVAQCGSVILSDYGKGGLTHVAAMIAAATKAGVPALVDPKGADFTPYKGARLVTPNRAELARVVGNWRDEASLVERAQNLRRALGLGALLVTRSEEGMSLFDEQGHLRIGTKAREVFDVTGAGDTVIAVLGALLAGGVALRDAVPIANVAAAKVVAKFGTASVSYEEIFA